MMGPVAQRLPGDRLHLSHGPIDLVIGAEGNREEAFEAAFSRLETVLNELMSEIDVLQAPPSAVVPSGSVAHSMVRAVRPFADVFVTPMASVAGAVADTVLDAMKATNMRRAYVNNGGDISLHLTPGWSYSAAMVGLEGFAHGTATISHEDPIRGIATSGWRGRSHSMGIADSVTVLARTAAMADVAATLIANAVDLPGHPSIQRRPASELRDMTDLGNRLVTTSVGYLSRSDVAAALEAGLARAREYLNRGLIHGASLHLRGDLRSLNLHAVIGVPESA